MAKRTVIFLVFDGVNQLDVSGPAEVFAQADRLGAGYSLGYVSPDGAVASSSIGASFVAKSRAAEVEHADTVIVPGASHLPLSPVEPELLQAIEHLALKCERVVSVCTGAFLLAAAGLLKHRRATTHWQHASQLSRLYPDIDVSPDALFVQDGRFHTSAGITAGIDLALHLVEADHGSDVAREVARQLVVYMQRRGGQSQHSTMLRLPRGSKTSVRAAIDAVTADPAAPHDPASLARIAGVSVRHLSRLFEAETGMTPTRYVQHVRIDLAKTMLMQGESVSGAAKRAGFGSAETMRRVFASQLGVSPRAYRERFSTTT